MKSVTKIIKLFFLSLKKLGGMIKRSYFRFIKGEENFWVVLFGWGALFYTLSLIVSFYTFMINLLVFLNIPFLKFVIFFLDGVVESMGVIMVFIYPVVLLVSLIKSSRKYSFVYTTLAIMFLTLFLLIHCALSINFYFPVSLIVLKLNMTSGIFGAICFIFGALSFMSIFLNSIFKTIKPLLTTKL
jgi:hypothetical protein